MIKVAQALPIRLSARSAEGCWGHSYGSHIESESLRPDCRGGRVWPGRAWMRQILTAMECLRRRTSRGRQSCEKAQLLRSEIFSSPACCRKVGRPLLRKRLNLNVLPALGTGFQIDASRKVLSKLWWFCANFRTSIIGGCSRLSVEYSHPRISASVFEAYYP